MEKLLNEEDKKVLLQLPKSVIEALPRRFIDFSCVVDCDPEYCESFAEGRGCVHKKECMAYKEAKELEKKLK
jgi:hypothetical protein